LFFALKIMILSFFSQLSNQQCCTLNIHVMPWWLIEFIYIYILSSMLSLAVNCKQTRFWQCLQLYSFVYILYIQQGLCGRCFSKLNLVQWKMATILDLFNAPGGVTFSKRGAIIRVNIYCIKWPFIFIK